MYEIKIGSKVVRDGMRYVVVDMVEGIAKVRPNRKGKPPAFAKLPTFPVTELSLDTSSSSMPIDACCVV